MSDNLETTGTPGAESTNSGAAAQPEAQPPQADGMTTLLSDGPAAPAEGTPAPQAPQAPVAYDLKAPEGMAWNDDQLKAFEGQAHSVGLSQEQAQKLLDAAHVNQQAHMEAHAAQVQRWAEEVRMDKDMGGPNFDATVMQARAGLKTFDADGQVYAMLQETGYANHPAVIRFLARIGKAHGEDDVITGKGKGDELPLWERLYGK